ncbi:MAG: hypothetical protein ABGX16_01365 [Pirellulales bacterium]
MAAFTDRKGNSWVIDVNTTSLKKLKTHGYDISETVEDGSIITRMMEDPIFLVDLIYVLCQDQAEKRSISDEQFGEMVGRGDIIGPATEALVEELTLFFRSRGQVMDKAMSKFLSLQGKMVEEAKRKIDSVDEDLVIERFGKSLTDSLDTLGLTQAPSP